MSILLLVGLVGALGSAFAAWQAVQRTDYEQALASLPASTLRATYTDWERVRSMTDSATLDTSASSRAVDQFLSRAYDQDLTSTSAVADATYALARSYGFSPLDASWEVFGQSREGAVAVLQFDHAVDMGQIERNLRRLGYTPPADDEGVWEGTVDLIASIDSSLTPVMQNVVVLPDEQMVLLSDNASYASSAASVVTGSADSLLEDADGVSALAEQVIEPASAVLFASDFACEALSMSSADAEDGARAEELVESAGGVSPLSGVVMAMAPDRSLTVGMHFETSEQAAANLEPRVELASGEAVGQGGEFTDRFTVSEGRSSDEEVVLDLEPTSPDQALLSDLSQGPVLFATC